MRRARAKGGDMTPEEQDEFNQMSMDARLAQDEANRLAREAQIRENELAEQARRDRERLEQDRTRLEQQVRNRDAELTDARRANELYDRLAYGRINSYVMGIVPLEYRMRLADRVAAITRDRLIAGVSESVITRELADMIAQLTEAARTEKPGTTTQRVQKTSSKKKRTGKTGKTGKPTSSKKKRTEKTGKTTSSKKKRTEKTGKTGKTGKKKATR